MIVLKKFSYALPRFQQGVAEKGAPVPDDLPKHLIHDLLAEGYIGEQKDPAPLDTAAATAAPETASATAAPETATDAAPGADVPTLPDDWQSLDAEGMKALAKEKLGLDFDLKRDAKAALLDYAEQNNIET